MKILILLICLLLSGCNSDKIPINLPTANTTGALYPLGASLANLWNKNIDEIFVSSQSSNGGVENLNLVYKKEAEVSLGVSSIIYQSYMGEGKFSGRENKDLRVIAGLYYNPNQIVVGKDINSIEDLKNKRFSPGASGSTTVDETLLHLENVGISMESIRPVYIGPSEGTDLVRNKSLDGLWIMAGAPTASVTELLSTSEVKLLSLDRPFVEKLQEKYPWYAYYEIPAGTYPSQDEPVSTTAIKMILYTRSDIDEGVVYKLTKVFWENIDTLGETNKSLKNVKIEDALKDLANLPVHPGALKYYEEVNNNKK